MIKHYILVMCIYASYSFFTMGGIRPQMVVGTTHDSVNACMQEARTWKARVGDRWISAVCLEVEDTQP